MAALKENPGRGFSAGDVVVYPAHGVGRITEVQTQVLGGQAVEVFVIAFEGDRMTLRLPLAKAAASGLRKLSPHPALKMALTKLGFPPAPPSGLWNRRAAEYLSKINSGDPSAIAEVVRDLHRRPEDPKGLSHGQRELYEQALNRLAAEVAAVEQTELQSATAKIAALLNAA
ncbi:MAG: CarD family transcriptional regulator [Rhodospirillaceae bacterium]